MHLSRFLCSAGVTALLGWAAPVLAAPYTYDSYTVLNAQNVRLVDPTLGFDELGGAGQITLSGGNLSGGSLASWCVDINDWLLNGGTFAAPVALTGQFALMVNALLSNATPLLSGNGDASAALQVAIWKVEYGSDLTVTADSTSLLNLADQWVSNVSGTNPAWQPDPTMQALVLRAGGGNQDQAFLSTAASYAITAAAVPEPASAAVLLGGLVVARVGRRRAEKMLRPR